ncbi:MAG: hypothetical protein U0Z26_09655 [Anaerolineales bacterium]
MMANNRTIGVRNLVRDVLKMTPKPYGEDIMLDVYMAIEYNPDWRKRYDDLCDELRDSVVNPLIGEVVKEETGLSVLREVSTKGQSHIVGRYTKLGAR